MNKAVIITAELQAALIEYLKDKPYNEVAAMIQGLATAPPASPPEIQGVDVEGDPEIS